MEFNDVDRSLDNIGSGSGGGGFGSMPDLSSSFSSIGGGSSGAAVPKGGSALANLSNLLAAAPAGAAKKVSKVPAASAPTPMKLGGGAGGKPDLQACMAEGMQMVMNMKAKGCLNDAQIGGIKKALGM
eukprot:PhM_4_TR9324/c0_g1_i1/m.20861